MSSLHRFFFLFLLPAVLLSNSLHEDIVSLVSSVTERTSFHRESAQILFLPLDDRRAQGYGSFLFRLFTAELKSRSAFELIQNSVTTWPSVSFFKLTPLEQAHTLSPETEPHYLLYGSVSLGFDNSYLLTLRLFSLADSSVVGAVTHNIPRKELEMRFRQ